MSLSERAMLVKLNMSQWIAKKQDKKVESTVSSIYGNQKNMGKFTKMLISGDAIKQVNSICSEARQFHYEQTLPWWDDGVRILPAKNFETYSEKMRSLTNIFEEQVQQFLDDYPILIENARYELGELYNSNDYPSTEDLKSKFGFKISINPMPDARDFRVQLGDLEADSIKKEIEERQEMAKEMAIKDLWHRLYESVVKISDKLKDENAMFKNSLISNVQDLINLLPRLNIAEDPKLEEMRRLVEDKLCNVHPQILRDDLIIRNDTAKHAQSILDQMSGFIG